LELARTFLDLALERRVGLLQLRRHAVESLAERFELVAGADCDALAQVAAADARGAFPERADRHHHAARKIEAGEEGQHEAGEDGEAGPPQRVIKWREGFFDRHFREDQPAESADPSMR